MKKEEFPTFLNEQPTIIFGRTGRELLIIAVGICVAYVSWIRVSTIFPPRSFIGIVLQVVDILICGVVALLVAFVKVASRPLEEWIAAFLFYSLIPKVYIYIPGEEGELSDEQNEMLVASISNRRSDNDGSDDEEDD